MKRVNVNISLAILLAVVSLGVGSGKLTMSPSTARAGGAVVADHGPLPVDDDMHHFMEYVFEPNYKRLKAAMASQPKNNADWKAIKGDSLTLAECANLLLARAPDENADQWRDLSVAVRTIGSELYQAARKTDYTAARQAYLTMLNNCNTCHQQFADGEHQLEP